MFLKFFLIFTATTTWPDLGSSLPVHFRDILLNPSCSFWQERHHDKSFFYLVGTAAHIEINVIRLSAYFEKTLFDGTEEPTPREGEDKDGDGETLEKDESDDLESLVRDMKILRKTLDEYYLPRLADIITIERRMISYNSNPFVSEFSLLKIKVHDLDCLLQHWIRQREPGYGAPTPSQPVVRADEASDGYEMQYINSEEMMLLDRLAERLDWFLGSRALVGLVRSLMRKNGEEREGAAVGSTGGIGVQPEEDDEEMEEEEEEGMDVAAADRDIRRLRSLIDRNDNSDDNLNDNYPY